MKREDPKEINPNDRLIVGYGNKIQIYDDFIISGDLSEQAYFTPFITD